MKLKHRIRDMFYLLREKSYSNILGRPRIYYMSLKPSKVMQKKFPSSSRELEIFAKKRKSKTDLLEFYRDKSKALFR